MNGMHKQCSEPETVGNFTMGGMGVDKSLRRPTIFVSGVHNKCSEPETVGRIHDGGAQSLRRPAILVSGMHKKSAEPETVGNFIMAVEKNLRRLTIFISGMRRKCPEPVYDGGAQCLRRPTSFVRGVHRARDCRQFSPCGCTAPATSRNFGEWNAQKVPRA